MAKAIACERAALWLSAFLDEQLAPAAMERIGWHVSSCGRCAQELAALARTRDLMAALPTPAPPDAYWERVYDNVRADRAAQAPAWRPWVTRVALGAPALAAAALAIAVYLAPVPSVRPTAPPVDLSRVLKEHASYRSMEPLADHAHLDYFLIRPVAIRPVAGPED